MGRLILRTEIPRSAPGKKKGQDRKSTQMPPNLPSLAVAVFRLAGHKMH